MDLFASVFKKFFAFVTPLFGVSDQPPNYADGEARPGRMNKDTGGIEVHIVGNSADSSASESSVLALLASSEAIQAALGAPNQEATQQLLLTALQGLGAGKTIADLATALTDDAATQALILGVLQSLKVDTTALASSLETLETYTDDLEGYAERTADAVEDSYAQSDAPLNAWAAHAPITVTAEPSGAQQLPDIPCNELKVIADVANTHPIYLGGSDVASDRSQDLEAGDLEIITRVSNANQYYVIAAATHTGQKVRIQTR
ncbi:hypothetical protein EKK58_05810 [Candidatus Dependentiae bacterium]|nr:MAG: hypothetical protein EKK58_05810 [Candidatus Dependentiae bacterium]